MAKMEPQQTATLESTPGNPDRERGQYVEAAPKDSDDRSVADVLKMFESGKKYVDRNYRKLWDDCWRVYKGMRVKYHYEGISDPVIPETFTIVESLVANIAGGKPEFQFFPTNEEQSTDTVVLNQLVDYYLECNKIDLKNQQWVRDMLMYGTGILEISWENGKPRIENVPLRDFIVDPQATSLETSRWAGRRYLADAEVLKKTMVFSVEENKMVKKYKNLDKLGNDTGAPTGSDEGRAFDKEFKERLQGTTLDQEDAIKNQIEVIRIHDKLNGRLIEIGNRKEFIYNEVTPFQKAAETIKVQTMVNDQPVQGQRELPAIDPFLPYAVLRDYVDSSLFFGMGEIEVIMDRAEMLNDWEAMDVDNAALQNTPVGWVDPQFADLIPEIEVVPNAMYPIPRNAMGFLERPQMGADLNDKKQAIQEQMRRATAADEVIQGASQDQGRITATEVNSTIAQATQRFSTKINNLESEGYAQLGSVIFKMTQIFVDKETAVRIVGPEGVNFKDYDPAEFSGDYEPHVKLTSTLNRQKVERGQKDNQIYQLMLGNPAYDQNKISQWMVKKTDPEISDQELGELMAPPPPPPPTPEQQAKMNEKPPTEVIQFSYKDASPWVKAQIEKTFGLVPDPMHLFEVERDAKQIAAEGLDIENPMTDSKGNLRPDLQADLQAEGPEATEATEVPSSAPTAPTPALASPGAPNAA